MYYLKPYFQSINVPAMLGGIKTGRDIDAERDSRFICSRGAGWSRQ